MEKIYTQKLAKMLHENGLTSNLYGRFIEISEQYLIENMFPVDGIDIEFENLEIKNGKYYLNLAKTSFENLPQNQKDGVIKQAEKYYKAINGTSAENLDEKLLEVCKNKLTYLKNTHEYNLQQLKDAKSSNDSDYSAYKYDQTIIFIVNNQNLENPDTKYFFKAWDNLIYKVSEEEFENLIDGLKVGKYLSSKPKENMFNKKKIGYLTISYNTWKEQVEKGLEGTFVKNSIYDYCKDANFAEKAANFVNKIPLKEHDINL